MIIAQDASLSRESKLNVHQNGMESYGIDKKVNMIWDVYCRRRTSQPILITHGKLVEANHHTLVLHFSH